jgi:ribosomal protein L35AE/L33A
LRETSGGKRGGLMIELSSEGCRISGVNSLAYTIDQQVTLEFDDGERVAGRVRWAHDGFVGVRFATALRPRELGAMLEVSRMVPERRYGT